MLKKSASFVLASLDGHFEHPAWQWSAASHVEIHESFWSLNEFFRSLLEDLIE